MNNKANERLWRVRNIQPGVLLLPFPPRSDPAMEILPINGTAVIEQNLLEVLGDLIVIVEEMAPITQLDFGLEVVPTVIIPSIVPTNEDNNEDVRFVRFFEIWNDAFGTTFRKANELLFLADNANIEILEFDKQKHHRVSEFGKLLQGLATLDNTPWVIKTRRRSNRTEYSVSLIQNSKSKNGSNPLI